jgi:LPXTG-site transpeptidase (sortase) family protein
MRRLQIALTAAVAVIALVACGGAPTADHPQTKATSTPSARPLGSGHAIPFTVTIKSIGLTATVEQVGVDKSGNMAIPVNPRNLGWYRLGTALGEGGDVVLDGHYDWYNMPQGPFFKLGSLKVGDEIVVTAMDGKTFTYKVSSAPATVPYNSKPNGLFATSGDPRMTLITCGGQWDSKKQTYTQRTLVNATLAK